MTIGPLAVRSESLTGFPSVPLSVKSGAFSPTASAAAEPAQPSVRTSPAINISRLRMNPSKARGSLLRRGLDGLLHERSIHDSFEGNRASHEAIVRPPLHLPLDICHEQTGVPVLKGEAEPDHLGSGVSILRGSPDDLVVVGAGSGSTVFLDQHGVVIVARGLEVAPHERRRPLAISSELLRVEHRDGLPRVEIAGPEEDLAEALRLRRAGKGLGKQDGVDLSALERLDGGHRKEDAEGDDGDLGRLADAQPKNQEGQEGDLGDGKGRRDERLPHRFGPREDAGGDAHEDTRGRARAKAQDETAQAGRDVNRELAGSGHLAELAHHAQRRWQKQRGNPAGAGQGLPEHEEASERGHPEQTVIGAAKESCAVPNRHSLGGHQPSPSTSAAWAWDFMSPQMRSVAWRKPGSPIWPSCRGRLSSTGTVSSTRPGRRDSTTTRSAM